MLYHTIRGEAHDSNGRPNQIPSGTGENDASRTCAAARYHAVERQCVGNGDFRPFHTVRRGACGDVQRINGLSAMRGEVRDRGCGGLDRERYPVSAYAHRAFAREERARADFESVDSTRGDGAMDGEPKKRNGKGNRGRLIAERLLVQRNYFYKLASEGKGASWNEISTYLKSESLDYAIDRKTFYRDCESLRDIFDLDLEYDTVNNEWCMSNPVFTERELETTINCIRYDSFLPEAEAEELAKKLNALICLDKVKTFSQNFQYDRVETTYNHVKSNLKIIFKAIDSQQCISFRYIDYPYAYRISECKTKEIDEYGRPKFYDKNGNALHEYHDSGVCSPVYVEQRRDGYFLYLSERDTVSGKTSKKFINVAEMENIMLLTEEQFQAEYTRIPMYAKSRKSTIAVEIEARTEYLDTVKIFFENAEITPQGNTFIAKVSVESALDLIPCMLMCNYSMNVISPREVIRSIERIAIDLSFHPHWLGD